VQPWKGEARYNVELAIRPYHPRARHIQTCTHKHPMRRGGSIARNLRGRSYRSRWRDHAAAAEATQWASPFRSHFRIAKEPEATLLQS
jgi:hypothetical protein